MEILAAANGESATRPRTFPIRSRHHCGAAWRACNPGAVQGSVGPEDTGIGSDREPAPFREDRKSTRLNSSHLGNSYAVFCLKKSKPGEIGEIIGTSFIMHDTPFVSDRNQ